MSMPYRLTWESLVYAAHMSHLTRTRCSWFTVRKIPLTLEEISEKKEAGELDSPSAWDWYRDLVKVNLTPEQVDEVRYDVFIGVKSVARRVPLSKAKLLAIMEKREHLYKPRKVFFIEVFGKAMILSTSLKMRCSHFLKYSINSFIFYV